jgi:hypothetical protein
MTRANKLRELARAVHGCAELRDDAYELVIGEAMPLGDAVAHEWIELARDLAAITSHQLGRYVDELDEDSRDIVEAAYAYPRGTGGGQ